MTEASEHGQSAARELRIQFTGSGSEYFRIWIVNLLLSLVTLGLYLPFAKARRISYFYANTLVDGQSLSFHGDPWRMFRGFVLLVVLMGVYAGAGRISPVAGLVAFIVLALIWPALWRASMRFRMGNTSWRGLRMRFTGSTAGAYAAMLPLYIPSLLMIIGSALYAPQPGDDPKQLNVLFFWYTFGGLGVMLLIFPFGLALIKRYQHGGYAYASQHSSIDVPTRRFYGLGLKGLLLVFVPPMLVGILAAVLIPILGAAGGKASPGKWLVIGVGLGAFYILLYALITPFFAARLQNLTWNGTRSEAISFNSSLRFRSLAWLTLKNWLFTALTLSLYRPFAAINTARMRLEAVSLRAEGDIDGWIARHGEGQQDATGEIAGDFFGIDMGL